MNDVYILVVFQKFPDPETIHLFCFSHKHIDPPRHNTRAFVFFLLFEDTLVAEMVYHYFATYLLIFVLIRIIVSC